MNLKLILPLFFILFFGVQLFSQDHSKRKTFRPIFNPEGMIEPDVFYELEDAPVLPIENYSEWLLGAGVVMVIAAMREKKFVKV